MSNIFLGDKRRTGQSKKNCDMHACPMKCPKIIFFQLFSSISRVSTLIKKISLDMDRLAEAKEELGGQLNDDTLQPMKISQKRDGNIFRCNATGAKKRLDSELLQCGSAALCWIRLTEFGVINSFSRNNFNPEAHIIIVIFLKPPVYECEILLILITYF